jgi:hypothetical protein
MVHEAKSSRKNFGLDAEKTRDDRKSLFPAHSRESGNPDLRFA